MTDALKAFEQNPSAETAARFMEAYEKTDSSIIAGFVPIVGDIMDGLSIAKDLYRGNYFDATVSGVMFLIPLGSASAGKKVIKAIESSPFAKKMAKDVGEETYIVYRSFVNDAVEYVGITKQYIDRAKKHAEIGREIVPFIPNLSKSDARAVEQVLIEHYGRITDRAKRTLGGQLNNLINSISPKNPIYQQQIKRGKEILRKNGFYDE